MDSYEGLMPPNSGEAMPPDYQVSSSFQQFHDSASLSSSYSSLPAMTPGFPNSASTPSANMNLQQGYSTPNSQSTYGTMSSGSSFSMPYDPPMAASTPMQLPITPQPTPNKVIHSCTYCGLVLSSANALTEHKRIHTGDRPFSCHICNKRFTQKAHLNIHKRTHTGEKPYACHICHKRFAQSSHLSSHKRIHTGEKPFVCGICNIGFTQKQRLDVHLKKHMEHPGGAGGMTPGQQVRAAQMMAAGVKLDQYRQGPADRDPASYMHMIGQGMPYIKQEATLEGETNSSMQPGTEFKSSSSSMPSARTEELSQRHNPGTEKNADGCEEDQDAGSNDTSDKSPKIATPSFSSEGMFLHPSGYVAYGGVEDSEESQDNSPSSAGAEAGNSGNPAQGNGSSSGGHRRKPSVVRKRYSESPAKESNNPESQQLGENGAANGFQTFQPLKSDQAEDNSEGEMDGSSTEDFRDTGEVLDDKNDPPYPGSSSGKAGSLNLTPRPSAQPVNMSTVETRSHSRRGSHNQMMGRPPHVDAMNGDKYPAHSVGSGGTLTYSGHSNSVSSSGLVRVNNRISLINFTGDELVSHLMKRDDVHKCSFCCLVFQDAAMYHIHRNMHDKADVRRCNMCGKLLLDKYDFTAHFLSMHQS